MKGVRVLFFNTFLINMKIDFYISSLSGGGAEKVLTTLAKWFYEDGNDVSIISLEKRPQFYQVQDGIKVIKYNNMRYGKITGTIKDLCSIRTYLKNNKADVSISFLSRTNLLLILANLSLFLKHKIIVCDRNNPKKEHSKIIFAISNLLYSFATKIGVQTKQIKSFYPKFLQEKIVVVENPIDTRTLNEQILENVIREKRIISIGRLEPQKDFNTLVLSFSKIAKKYPEWHLDIFGCGEMKDQLEKIIDNLDLKKRILLKGRTQKPYYELKKSSIFVLSSFYEGFPNVLCEAMYAENLCISSNCVSGPKELIDNGVNGWLFEIGKVEELTKLLDMAIRIHDSKKGEEIRSNAYNSVKRLYLDNIGNEWKKLIKSLI